MTALGRVELQLVGLPEKAFARDVTRRLRFVVHAADWLHSMDADAAITTTTNDDNTIDTINICTTTPIITTPITTMICLTFLKNPFILESFCQLLAVSLGISLNVS